MIRDIRIDDDLSPLRNSLSPEDRERFRSLDERTARDFCDRTKYAAAIVACDDAKTIVGFAHLQRNSIPTASHVLTLGIAVAPGFRRRGVGRNLIYDLLLRAEEDAAEKVTLRVRGDNNAAIDLYESVGFRVDGCFLDQERVKGVSYDYYSMSYYLNREEETTIPWSRPHIGAREFREVVRVFQRDWYSQGQATEAFEKSLGSFVEQDHVVAMNNGTSALIAAISCSFQKGSRIAVPAFTHISTMNALLTAGMEPRLVDVDPLTANVEVSHLPSDIDGAVVVDIAGHPIDYEAFKAKGVPIVEDAAQALGSAAHGLNTGHAPWPVVFSFHTAKLATTIEGGAVTTDSANLAARLRRFRNHGETAKFEWGERGLNFRMTDVQSAIGLGQLSQLQKFLFRRSEVATKYSSRLPKRVRAQETKPYVNVHSRMMYLVASAEREAILANFGENVQYRRAWQPIHKQPAFKDFARGSLPGSERWGDEGFCLPMFNDMTNPEVEDVLSLL